MSRYGLSYYGVATYDSEPARLSYNVSPMSATALTYSTVLVTWQKTLGDFTDYRLVRNQDHFPESQEDGVVIWATTSTIGTGVQTITDGDVGATLGAVAGVPGVTYGKFVYYRMWLKTPVGIWLPAGDAYALVPQPHSIHTPEGVELKSTHGKFMDMLPRVYTSASGSPIDEVDLTSDLSTFLKPFSFALDEAMTFSDLILPDFSGGTTSPSLLPLQAHELGIKYDSTLNLTAQKSLIRDAIYTYGIKGTKKGVEVFSEDLTGFSPTVSVSPNLFLSLQDSTFYKQSVGNWNFLGTNGSFTAQNTVIPKTYTGTSTAVVDSENTGKVVVGTVGSKITNGISSGVDTAIPVLAGKTYSFSFDISTSATSGTNQVTPAIVWYDSKGAIISASPMVLVPQTVTNATGTVPNWSTLSMTATAPGRYADISAAVVTSSVATLTVSTGHPFSVGDSVTIDLLDSGNSVALALEGTKTVTATTTTSISFATTAVDILSTDILGTAYAVLYPADTATTATSGTGSVATITTSSAHGLIVGTPVTVTGVTPVGYRGTYIVTAVPSTTQFSFASSTTGSQTVAGKVWTSETAAVYAGVSLTFGSAVTYYVDRFQFADTSIAASSYYNEARAVTIFCNPTKINLIPNPNFKTDITGWAASGSATLTRDTGFAYQDTASLKVVTGAAIDVGAYNNTAAGAVSTGNYTASVWVNGTAGNKVALDFIELTSGSVEVGRTTSSDLVLTGAWQRISVTRAITTGTLAWLLIKSRETTAQTFYVDGVQLELGVSATDYFDGSFPSAFGAGYIGGTAPAASYIYTNKDSKMKKLVAQAPSVLPVNTAYIVKTYSGIAGSGIA